jgi:hypothetical protein
MLTLLFASPLRTSAGDYYWPNDFSTCASDFTDNAYDILSTYDQDVSTCWDALSNCLNATYNQEQRDQCAAQFDECVAGSQSQRNSSLDTEGGRFSSCLGRADTRPADYDHCTNARVAVSICENQFEGIDAFSELMDCRAQSGIDQCQ